MSDKLWFCNSCNQTYEDPDGDGQCPNCLSLDVEPVGVAELPLAPKDEPANSGSDGYIWSH